MCQFTLKSGTCPHVKVVLQSKDESPFFMQTYAIKEEQKPIIEKEKNRIEISYYQKRFDRLLFSSVVGEKKTVWLCFASVHILVSK